MRRPYYGWLVVAACFLGTFTVYGVSYSFGVFLDRMLATFDASRGATSLAFGVQTAALYVGASGIGVLVDRYGTRRSLLAGAAVTAAGLLLASRASSLAVLLLTYGAATGVGLSVVYVVSYATVTRWFDRRMGLAGGLASAGLGVGMLAVVPAANWLTARVGWRSALVALAAGVIALLVPAAAVVRDTPADVGVSPPDEEFVSGPPANDHRTLRDQYDALIAVGTSPPFLLLLGGWIAVYGSLYVVLAHLVLHAVDLGLSRATGATALAALGAASALGRVGIGHLADSLGRTRVFVACSAGMGVATAALAWSATPITLVGVAALFGLAYGGNGALLAPLTADLFGRADVSAVFGLASLSFAVSGLLAPPAAGATFDALGTYRPALVAGGLLSLAGAGAVALADRAAGPAAEAGD